MMYSTDILLYLHLRMGVLMIGPKPFWMSHSIPRDGSGVRMSLNMMTPSGWNALHGCNESSVAISAFSERCLKPNLSEYLHSTRDHPHASPRKALNISPGSLRRQSRTL